MSIITDKNIDSNNILESSIVEKIINFSSTDNWLFSLNEMIISEENMKYIKDALIYFKLNIPNDEIRNEFKKHLDLLYNHFFVYYEEKGTALIILTYIYVPDNLLYYKNQNDIDNNIPIIMINHFKEERNCEYQIVSNSDIS